MAAPAGAVGGLVGVAGGVAVAIPSAERSDELGKAADDAVDSDSEAAA